MPRTKKESSNFHSVSAEIHLGPRTDLSFLRSSPSAKWPEEGFFVKVESGVKGACCRIDAEGLVGLRQWVNGAEYKGLLSRIEASEAGRSTPETKTETKTETAPPSPGAGLLSTDQRIDRMVAAGMSREAAAAHVGVDSPSVLRPVHKTATDDLLAEMDGGALLRLVSKGDPVLITAFASYDDQQLAKAAKAASSRAEIMEAAKAFRS